LEIMPGKANRARIGRAPAAKARDVIGALRLVLFAPEDLALVRGDPAERRGYVDDLLVQRQPRYAGVRADYERVLKQRNALLRTAYLARKMGGTGGRTADLSTLDVWDTHLAEHGAVPLEGRLEQVPRSPRTWRRRTTRWLPSAAARRSAIAAGSATCRRIVTTARTAFPLRRPANEVERVTLVGPHRDDGTDVAGSMKVREPWRVVVVCVGAPPPPTTCCEGRRRAGARADDVSPS
jgi:DNA replication and repair protein RecF